MKHIKPKLEAAARFIVQNGETILQCLIFVAAFLKAAAERERKSRR